MRERDRERDRLSSYPEDFTSHLNEGTCFNLNILLSFKITSFWDYAQVQELRPHFPRVPAFIK